MNRFSQDEIATAHQVVEQRRDIRHFLPDPVEPALQARLMHAAHMTASGGFMQPWHFIRITDAVLRVWGKDASASAAPCEGDAT